ncbi:MAG: DUF1573 domain-containing protein [Planctomycetia bacterium]|nr:DUF1573 domain-containing protein [Planctomycetia bacterium]
MLESDFASPQGLGLATAGRTGGIERPDGAPQIGIQPERLMRLKVVHVILLGLALALSGDRARAQDPQWAHKMFDKVEHDFGIVPSNADLKHRIKITNKYQQTVHIAGVTSSCGCTAGKPSKESLASEESVWLDLSMDTRRFRGLKETTVTVTFDQPILAQVQIPVKAFINPDVLLNPGAFEFRGISKGVDSNLRMVVVYNGRGQWIIKEAVCKNPHVAVKLLESRRDPFSNAYELSVTIKGTAPLGDLRDQVTLLTTDPGNPQIPVLIEARVEPEFVVTPDVVSFGNLTPGERKTINIVVRGKKPFAIEKIESEKTAGTFETRIPTDTKAVHVLPLTLVAPKEAGAINEEFSVTVTGSTEHVTFKAYGKVLAGANPGPAAAGPAPGLK